MIRAHEFMPGVPVAGHITSGGWWHPGPILNCVKCDTAPPAPPIRGANLMRHHLALTGPEQHPGDVATCSKCRPPDRGWELAEKVLVAVPGTVERVITVGYTQGNRDAGYVPMIEGYRPGAAQHVLTISVQLSPDLEDQQIAELVFIATNAPDLDAGTPEQRIRDAIVDTGYKGTEAHWSLSIGDTVRVGGSPLLACGDVIWTTVEEEHR